MKGHIRNIYPGGNTPEGFYSYYNYILPQRKAEKIFCLKGGPGVGKSTFMKEAGRHFAENGEDVDLLWCSSDADSLDGIVLKNRRVALIDGTSPHMTDPVNPAAVDKIIDLGQCWNEKGIRKHRKDIIELGEKISETFGITYGYLRTAGIQHRFMADILDNVIKAEQLYDIRRQLDMKLSNITALKRAESKMMRESAMGMNPKPGEFVKFFAGALTPAGIKNGLESLTEELERLIIINMPVGFRSENILSEAAKRISDAGFDCELYYCPMRPADKLEHIIVPDGKFGIISCNSYHRLEVVTMNKRVMFIDAAPEYEAEDERREIIEDIDGNSSENIDKAVEYLKKAKQYHDRLEEFYIENMDFKIVSEIREQVVYEIENI